MQTHRWFLIGVLVGCVTLEAATTSAEPKKPAEHEKAPAVTDARLRRLTVASDADPDSGPPPLKVQFEAEVYEGDEAVKPVFTWNFGDGTATAKGAKVTHVYKKAGSYTAIITVTSADGRGGTSQQDIQVEADE